jgi:glucosyl-dolichyl phosphate glucuronosyltransferase
MALTVSVIVPTFRRPDSLKECLEVLLNQEYVPLEVVIIDNDPGRTAQTVVKQFNRQFGDRGIGMCYVTTRKNSIPIARNLGVKLTTGDIVLFMDDDFILEKDYVSEIIKVYEMNPQALGVQGYAIENWCPPNLYRRIFYLHRLEHNKCQVMPSIYSAYPLELKSVMNCEWMGGFNSSFRRSVLEEFHHDEKLMKYSLGEDLDASFRIFKERPGTLFITPFARGIHKIAPGGRMNGKERVYMQEVYSLYLFYKLFTPTLKNRGVYLWSRFGLLLQMFNGCTLGALRQARLRVSAYAYCLMHAEEIKRGDLEFFNSTLS